ncbi:MAG: hypothetical protein ACTHQQ_20270 [Solirubrobacteraceae bacterium]
MSHTVPAQHPAVVLRSNYVLVQSLLAIATIAIVGLTIAVVVLAIGTGTGTPEHAAIHSNPMALHLGLPPR